MNLYGQSSKQGFPAVSHLDGGKLSERSRVLKKELMSCYCFLTMGAPDMPFEEEVASVGWCKSHGPRMWVFLSIL